MKFLERFWWLRLGAIWFHLSLFLRVRFAIVPIGIGSTRRKLTSDETYRLIAIKLLALGAEMERRPLPPPDAYMRPYRLWLRFGHYSVIVFFLTMMPEEMRGRLSVDVARQVVHLCEVATSLYELGAKDHIADRANRSKRTPPVVRQSRAVASIYKLLASTYLELQPNDAAFDCATAFGHLTKGATHLEDLDHPQARWDAAGIWCELAEANLAHPYETDSVENARKALLRARDLAVRDIGALKPPPMPMTNRGQGRTTSDSVSRRRSREYLREVLESRRRVQAGDVDPSYSWWRVAPLMYRINCQLGAVYRAQGNLTAAIDCFSSALSDFTQDHDQSAYVNCEIGYTYLECGRPRNKNDLNLAIRHFDKVIELQGKTKFIKPLIRALIGNARAIVGLTEVAADIERTKMMSRLDVMAKNLHIAMIAARKSEMTALCQEAAFVLGLVHMNKREYARAYKAFALSSRLVDRLQKSSRTLRLKWYRIGTTTSLYNNLLFTAMRYKRIRKPGVALSEFAAENLKLRFLFTFSERGRAVFLQEEMVNRTVLPLGVGDETMSGFLALRRAWHQAQIDLQTRETTPAHGRMVTILRKKRDELEDEYFRTLAEIREKCGDRHYDPDMPVPPVHFYEVRKAIDRLAMSKPSALVLYHVSFSRIYVMILLPRCPGFRHAVYCKEVTLDCEDVGEAIRGWETRRGDQNDAACTQQSGERKNWIHWGRSSLIQTLDRLRELAEYPSRIIKKWEERTASKIERVILAPHKFLHLVPLHAIPLPSGEPWGDTVAIQYVPSVSVLCRLAHAASSRVTAERKPETKNAVAISGMSDSRSFEWEATKVSQILGGSTMRGNEMSIAEVVQGVAEADYIHFSCHGRYDHSSPMFSGLEFLGSDDAPIDQSTWEEGKVARGRLTLGEIFERVRLPHAPIVVLSACESGISKIEQSHDEYIGLPAGFLYAGARTVVSSLWPVDDSATYLLMARMTQQVAQGSGIAQALKIAQQWLRTLPKSEALMEVAAIGRKDGGLTDTDEIGNLLQRYPFLQTWGEYPFAEPFWWAGFTINGLG
jgi:CHAT domain-containing protein/tetratricopeptide (TPR) repeat protein